MGMLKIKSHFFIIINTGQPVLLNRVIVHPEPHFVRFIPFNFFLIV